MYDTVNISNMVLQLAIYFIIAVFSTCFGLSNITISKNILNDRNVLDITKIPDNLKNIVVTNYADDDNYERIIVFEDVIAKETNFKTLTNSLRICMISDGNSLLQLIYSNTNELLNCDYVNQRNLASNFILELLSELKYVRTENITSMKRILYNQNQSTFTEKNESYNEILDIRSLNGMFKTKNSTYVQFKHITDIPNDIKPWLKYDNLKLECRRKIQQIKRLGRDQQRLNSKKNLKRKVRSVSDVLLAPNTKWCGRGHSAENYNELGGASSADKCCRKHDHCKENIQGMSTKWELFNFRMYTISHCNCDLRYRRNLSSLLRIPGTKWCGKGWDAKRYSDLGGYSKVDQCCRQHDKSCLFWIMGFETKYNFYNWRVNTLMHCKCDERFRTCLKMADTADADLVGKIFFNVVQTKCFVIKSEKVCTKRSKEGKCEKTTRRKKAYLHENRRF